MDIFYPIRQWFTNRQKRGEQLTTATVYENSLVNSVTEETALQLSSVWACTRIIAQTIASLPIIVYEKTASGKVKTVDHWFAKLMAHKPNRYQTRYEFYEYQVFNLCLHGNCYAKIGRLGGEIISLMPMAAQQVEKQLLSDGSIVFLYTHDDVVEALSADSVWHVMLNCNWLVGRSPLSFGANIISIAQSAEKTVQKIYGNGAKPSGVLMLDKLLKPEQRAELRNSFSSLTVGNDDRLLLLEAGMKFEPISLSPQDIELLQSRRFQLEEICRWFGVPSVLVNDTAGSTVWGSGITQIVDGFHKLNLRPYLEALECSAQVHLIGEIDSRTYEIEHSFEALLRSSQKERYEGYRTGIAGGFLTPNEARRAEWLPELEGGDTLYIQGAMIPLEDLAERGREDAS